MTLDESIKRYTDNAEYERTHGNLQGCLEFRQLAEWLTELKQLREQTKWIPVSERLPNTDGVYIVTRRLFDNQIDTEPYYMVDACYFDGSSTWHNDNRINHTRNYLTDVVEWMPLPEPYREESEVTQDADSN